MIPALSLPMSRSVLLHFPYAFPILQVNFRKDIASFVVQTLSWIIIYCIYLLSAEIMER